MLDSEITEEFKKRLNQSPNMALAVVAISVLTTVIKKSKSTTMMELNNELKHASEVLIKEGVKELTNAEHSGSSISLTSGCELFNRYVTRQFLEIEDFNECKQRLIERGEYMAKNSEKSRNKIVKLFRPFIRDNMTIMILGYSRVVLSILLDAAQHRRFSVIVTESRPDAAGYKAARQLKEVGIPVTLIIDSASAHFMHKVDFVLIGAEGVVENGGVINKIGTYQAAIVAKAHKKPVYVAAESFKFVRQFPLQQSDIGPLNEAIHKPNFVPITDGVEDLNEDLKLLVKNPNCDLTPPQYITLLFSDLGILTPSAVSDELIKLYY